MKKYANIKAEDTNDYLKGLSYPPFIIQVTVILIVVLDEKGGNGCPSSLFIPQDTYQYHSVFIFDYSGPTFGIGDLLYRTKTTVGIY